MSKCYIVFSELFSSSACFRIVAVLVIMMDIYLVHNRKTYLLTASGFFVDSIRIVVLYKKSQVILVASIFYRHLVDNPLLAELFRWFAMETLSEETYYF